MKKLLLLSVIGLTLAGCGGSDDNTEPTPMANPSSVIGTVDSVNSESNTVTVNGYSYQIANVTYGSTSLPTTYLQPNMMVQIGSNISRSTAVNVQLEPTMIGIIRIIDANTFSLNGATLTFNGLSSEIENGDRVMVSSLPTANAGYKVLSVVKFDIEFGEPDEIEGRISNINVNTKTFTLGANVNVQYDERIINLQIGQWVEVEGAMQGNDFVASKVEVENYDYFNGDNEVEGIVTWVAKDQSEFTLNYRGSFVVDNTTRFEDGLKAHLKQGVEVEVRSRMNAGKRIATIVEFDDMDSDQDNEWDGKEFECEGLVSNLDQDGRTFTMTRCENGFDQVIPNRTVTIDAQTRFDGILEQNITNGIHIEVEGFIIGDQNIASEVEYEFN
ncbi:putative lipoprotein (plasmid) [Aliivibrio wodanis]|uniref:Putative lipoprotein n=1 Tax=Aliivibrio wodanis TaxID=80852 RepID=A0A090I8M2_9GAMM|nr:putative lipoprotein [Aliivibrio wodanis]